MFVTLIFFINECSKTYKILRLFPAFKFENTGNQLLVCVYKRLKLP